MGNRTAPFSTGAPQLVIVTMPAGGCTLQRLCPLGLVGPLESQGPWLRPWTLSKADPSVKRSGTRAREHPGLPTGSHCAWLPSEAPTTWQGSLPSPAPRRHVACLWHGAVSGMPTGALKGGPGTEQEVLGAKRPPKLPRAGASRRVGGGLERNVLGVTGRSGDGHGPGAAGAQACHLPCMVIGALCLVHGHLSCPACC